LNRRDFAFGLGAAPWLATEVLAANDPVEGKEYKQLQTPVPVGVPGKIEVMEFFGYWCPHCSELEPKLEPWVRKLPSTVNFRRMAVSWQPSHEPYQRLYFALEAMGIGGDIHRKVFDAVHLQRLRLDNDAGLSVFATANGIDKAKLAETMKGFSVSSKANLAMQLFRSYKLDSVPALTVNGRYVTSPEMARGDEQALRVVEVLMRK
jgi:thiol:disulfide interchange protein DsbA